MLTKNEVEGAKWNHGDRGPSRGGGGHWRRYVWVVVSRVPIPSAVRVVKGLGTVCCKHAIRRKHDVHLHLVDEVGGSKHVGDVEDGVVHRAALRVVQLFGHDDAHVNLPFCVVVGVACVCAKPRFFCASSAYWCIRMAATAAVVFVVGVVVVRVAAATAVAGDGVVEATRGVWVCRYHLRHLYPSSRCVVSTTGEGNLVAVCALIHHCTYLYERIFIYNAIKYV